MSDFLDYISYCVIHYLNDINEVKLRKARKRWMKKIDERRRTKEKDIQYRDKRVEPVDGFE